MKIRYSRLLGIPVVSSEGRHLGRVIDVILARQGNEAVGRCLEVAPGPLALLAVRFGRKVKRISIPISEIAQITGKEIRLRAGVVIDG